MRKHKSTHSQPQQSAGIIPWTGTTSGWLRSALWQSGCLKIKAAPWELENSLSLVEFGLITHAVRIIQNSEAGPRNLGDAGIPEPLWLEGEGGLKIIFIYDHFVREGIRGYDFRKTCSHLSNDISWKPTVFQAPLLLWLQQNIYERFTTSHALSLALATECCSWV